MDAVGKKGSNFDIGAVLEEENGKQWKRQVGGHGSRGKLAVSLGAFGVQHQILGTYSGKKINAKSLLQEAPDELALLQGEQQQEIV